MSVDSLSESGAKLSRRTAIKGAVATGFGVVASHLPEAVSAQTPDNTVEKERVKPFKTNILTFHKVKSPDSILEEIHPLLSEEHKAISIQDICQHFRGETDLSLLEKSFVVTIDDGLKNQLQALEAAEIAESAWGVKVPMAFAVMTKFEDKRDDELTEDTVSYFDDDPTHAYMTLGDMLKILDRGHDLLSHTVNHANLPKLDDSDLQGEIEISSRRLNQFYERVGREEACPKALVYPYGYFDNRVITEAVRQGFEVAFSTESNNNHTSENRYHLGRFGKT